MYLDSAKKKELFEKYGKSATNTGSAESQIALFTFRISHLTEHLKVFPEKSLIWHRNILLKHFMYLNILLIVT